MTASQWAVEVRGLTKTYGGVPVVDGIDLAVEHGEVFALLGPNGAGKTTTVEILEGLRPRSAGSVSVLGEDPHRYGRRWRDRIGVVPQTSGSFGDLSVTELLSHFAACYSEPQPVATVIAKVGLTSKAKTLCRNLSGGQRRRVDVALALVGSPELIFLDEPTTGLDPEVRRQAWDVIRDLTSGGTTILLTTHYLDEVEELAQRAGILVAGRLVDVGTPATIGGRGGAPVTVSFDRTGPLAAVTLPDLGAADQVSVSGAEVSVATATPTAVLDRVIGWAAQTGVVEVPGLRVHRPTLEDVYLRMISEHERTAA